MTDMKVISISDYAKKLYDDIESLKDDENLTPGLRNVIDSPAAYALTRTLQNSSFGYVSVSSSSNTSVAERFENLIQSGADTLEKNNIAYPHLEDYYAAQEISVQTGHDILTILNKFDDVRPKEFNINVSETPNFSVDTSPGVLTAQTGQNISQIEGLEPQNYQEYDVHLMAYPLTQKDIPFTDLSIVSRDSHAYIVVTEKGAELLDENGEINQDAALLVTRAGPDDVGILGSSRSSDSSFGDDQNPTDEEKGKDGDVYVTSFEGSRGDLNVENPFLLQKTTITDNINEIEGKLENFRDYINGQDINYELLQKNSNTYAGDVYELLTGEEPDNPHAGLFGRRTPALDNDLVNYEQTDYANDFE